MNNSNIKYTYLWLYVAYISFSSLIYVYYIIEIIFLVNIFFTKLLMYLDDFTIPLTSLRIWILLFVEDSSQTNPTTVYKSQ